ncbi:MAG: hypothetical protein H6840_06955 [Planctomycetes bacterium]|nr:hypothetical protein [Planctomycetota bacterium]
MRYLPVLACSLLVLLSACTFDDGDKPTDDSATAVAGRDIVLDIGVARLEISGATIGSGTGQIPEGSKVKLEVVKHKLPGREVYSPVVQVSVTDGAGAAVTGLDLSPAAKFELSYDFNAAIADGNTSQTQILLLKIDGTSIDELTYTTIAPAEDTEYAVAWPGRVRGFFTSFSRFAVSDGGSGGTTPPAAVALTGTVSTVLTATVWQLADTGAVYNVSLAVPTSLTTTPPAVVTLNDASFDAGNPLDPNNRAVTVQTGGVTYTSDHPAASVVFQLNTFTGSSSSGSLVGTVIQQGGSTPLAINFTFTTGAAGATAIGGTVADLAGRRTLNLQDGAGAEQVVILMPDTLPNGALDPITFDDASFDSGNPTDPAGRLLTVTVSGETFSSDVPVVGSVTLTFTSWDNVTKVGAGTITGTVVSSTPATKTLNYTFTTTAGATGGSGTFTAGTPVDVTTTDVADEAAITYDISSGDYMCAWLSDVGTTNRTIEMAVLDADTLAVVGSVVSFEPSGAFDPAGGFDLAVDNAQDVAAVGATGANAATDSVLAVFYDVGLDSLNDQVTVGTGTAPRVEYHVNQDHFVIAWQSGTDVMARVYDWDGTPIGTAQTVFGNAILKGLATPGTEAVDEALITADDGSGIVGRYLEVSTGTLAGASFDISTSLSGGLAGWDEVGGQYLVLYQELVGGFFTSQVLLALDTSTTTPVGSPLTLAAAAAPVQWGAGNAGTIFADTGANMYPVDSSVAGPALVAGPLLGALSGLNIDTTADGAALAGAGSDRYVLLAAKGAAGVTAVPLTLTP